jgi:hypothetical protein
MSVFVRKSVISHISNLAMHIIKLLKKKKRREQDGD